MSQIAFLTSLGFVLMGFVLGIAVYPRFLGLARKYLDEFRGGTCAHCGLETFVMLMHLTPKNPTDWASGRPLPSSWPVDGASSESSA